MKLTPNQFEDRIKGIQYTAPTTRFPGEFGIHSIVLFRLRYLYGTQLDTVEPSEQDATRDTKYDGPLKQEAAPGLSRVSSISSTIWHTPLRRQMSSQRVSLRAFKALEPRGPFSIFPL